MTYMTTRDGVKLYFEQTGSGTPLLFAHEFAGDFRSWEPQIRFFSRRYRCITYNMRGYPPSDVPADFDRYTQAGAADDIADLLRHLKIERAHIAGFSLGGYASLHFGFRYPQMALSLCCTGTGYGSRGDIGNLFRKDMEAMATTLEQRGTAAAIKSYKIGPARVQFQNKDPRGYGEFSRCFDEHSNVGLANTLRGINLRRPQVQELGAELKALEVPLLVIAGDEDVMCIEPALFIKQTCMAARVCIVPGCGHGVCLEEPDFYNRVLLDWITLVDSGRWRPRDPRSLGKSTLENSPE